MKTVSYTKCLLAGAASVPLLAKAAQAQPNILFAIADDWGVHAGVYGDKVVKTPTFDRLAKEGILFEHAYIASPSCAPSPRSSSNRRGSGVRASQSASGLFTMSPR